MFLKRWTAAALCLALSAGAASAQHPLKTTATGNPQIKSVDAIAFAPQGVLLIGDGQGRQIVAVDTKDTKPITWTKTDINNIDGALAARVGTTAKGIEIVKIAVNPASKRAYFAVRTLENKKSLILTLDGDGKVNEFGLDNVTYAALPLPEAGKTKIALVTDIAWANDRLVAAVQANETFGNRIFTANGPLNNKEEGAMSAAETYHVAHGKWETKAPIYTLIPFEESGQQYVLGAFTCTPLVKYPLSELKAGGKMKGQTLIELGNGNKPRDMFSYKKDGKQYILVSTHRIFNKQPVGPSPYWVARIDAGIVSEKDNVNEKAPWRADRKTLKPLTDRAMVVETFHGVMLMDRLGEDRALVIRDDGKGNKNLAAIALP